MIIAIRASLMLVFPEFILVRNSWSFLATGCRFNVGFSFVTSTYDIWVVPPGPRIEVFAGGAGQLVGPEF